MLLLVIAAVALVVAFTVVVLLRRSAPADAATQSLQRRRSASEAAAASSLSPAPSLPKVPMPPQSAVVPQALRDLRLQRADDLPEERRRACVAAFKDIPRPPRLLHRLLSPDFVNEASSTQLVELIIGEPLIAARVLTAINAPAYGLKAPVVSIGQAVTYLGLNNVRGLCLQYILIASFQADSAERKQRLDTTWNASALASELALQLAQRLGFEDRGALLSTVVLSFLGRLATTASVTPEQLASIPARGLLDRTVAEQKALGLSASQIGRLLMHEWGLPAGIADDAADIDAVLLAPASAFDAERGSRLALAYVCARLGERLAEGSLAGLSAFDPFAEGDVECFHLRSFLALPKLARLMQAIQSSELAAAIQPMLSTMRR